MPRFRIILIPAIRLSGLDGVRSGLPTPSGCPFERCDIAPALSGVEPSSLQSRTALHTSGDRRHGQVSTENWCCPVDSNHRPDAYKASALSLSYNSMKGGFLFAGRSTPPELPGQVSSRAAGRSQLTHQIPSCENSSQAIDSPATSRTHPRRAYCALSAHTTTTPKSPLSSNSLKIISNNATNAPHSAFYPNHPQPHHTDQNCATDHPGGQKIK